MNLLALETLTKSALWTNTARMSANGSCAPYPKKTTMVLPSSRKARASRTLSTKKKSWILANQTWVVILKVELMDFSFWRLDIFSQNFSDAFSDGTVSESHDPESPMVHSSVKIMHCGDERTKSFFESPIGIVIIVVVIVVVILLAFSFYYRCQVTSSQKKLKLISFLVSSSLTQEASPHSPLQASVPTSCSLDRRPGLMRPFTTATKDLIASN